MSDPPNPVLTDRLVTPAMVSPHESLVVSQQRGVLAAVLGNPTIYPGLVDIYDISEDCRHPVLKSSSPTGILGHESGLSPDGNTFYSASPGTADARRRRHLQPLGCRSRSGSGPMTPTASRSQTTATAPTSPGAGSGLIILDISEIQARVPDPRSARSPA